MAAPRPDLVDQLLAPLLARGGSAYLGEPVTQLEHALQTAALANAAGATPDLVVGSLLHDIGWLLGGPADERGSGSGSGAGGVAVERGSGSGSGGVAVERGSGSGGVAVERGSGSGGMVGSGGDDHSGRGAAYLERWFPPSVTEPVRLHVPAKRWLCATSPEYNDVLSDESKRTLDRQGGPMDVGEQVAFESTEWSADAVRLRRWDDAAKDPARSVPGLDHWRPLIAAVVT